MHFKPIFKLFLSGLLPVVSAFNAIHAEGIEKAVVQVKDQPDFILSQKEYPAIGVTEFTLKNGMRVCLKPTTFDEDEILIRISAPGGYALLSPEARASAELAPQVALESGLGGLTSDKLSVLLYEDSVDFSMKVEAFSRSIEASTTEESIGTALLLTNYVFTKPNFSQSAFNTVKSQALSSALKRDVDFDRTFEDAYSAINTQNLCALKPLSPGDIRNIDYAKSKQFFDYAYCNPSSFVCVIVGNFKIEEVKPLIRKYLSTIPLKEVRIGSAHSHAPSFPKGISKKVISSHKQGDSIVRLTFPVTVKLDQNRIHPLELACQVMEARLRKAISSYLNATQGVDVAYEFPLYPLLDFPWITIQFRCDPKIVENLSQIILSQLEQLQTVGPSDQEIEDAKTQQKQSDEFWVRENDFWLASLSNYYLVGWSPDNILKDLDKDENLSDEKIREVIKTYFNILNYTLISSQRL